MYEVVDMSSPSCGTTSSTASDTAITGQVADVKMFMAYLKQLFPVLLDSSLASIGKFIRRNVYQKNQILMLLRSSLASHKSKLLLFEN